VSLGNYQKSFLIKKIISGVAFESLLGPGMYETEINTESFRSGTYIYTLIYDGQRASKKMTVYK
jgi:hypothetical protein